jgi:hypothetical protein
MVRLWWNSKMIRIDIAPVADVEVPEPPPVLVAVTVSKPNTGTRIGPTEIGGKRVIITCVRSELKEHPMVRGPLNGPLALAFVVFTRKVPVKVASRLASSSFCRMRKTILKTRRGNLVPKTCSCLPLAGICFSVNRSWFFCAISVTICTP